MLTLPPSVRVFLCLTPADMRRSLDGLAALTREILWEDPLSGHLFVYFNRRRDRVKVLLWDRSGLALYYKRLEKGTFRLSAFEGSASPRAEIDSAELALILEGIDLANARRRPRFALPRATACG
jgi:transposase